MPVWVSALWFYSDDLRVITEVPLLGFLGMYIRAFHGENLFKWVISIFISKNPEKQ